MIIGGSGSGKTDVLLNLIKEKYDTDKTYLYAKDLSEPKYEFLIKRREDAGTKHLNDPNAIIECSNTMDYIYGNIDDYNPNRKRKMLIVFDDMIADIMTNKKFQAIIKELFAKYKKTKYFSSCYHSILPFCSKRCQIKFSSLLNNENQQQERIKIKKYCV